MTSNNVPIRPERLCNELTKIYLICTITCNKKPVSTKKCGAQCAIFWKIDYSNESMNSILNSSTVCNPSNILELTNKPLIKPKVVKYLFLSK